MTRRSTFRIPDLRRWLVLVAAIAVSGCGNWSRVGRWYDTGLDVPTEVATKSTLLGAAPWRMARGVRTVCVGVVLRDNIEERDQEAARARRAWENRFAGVLQGTAPNVIPAAGCQLDPGRRYVVRGTDEQAVVMRVDWSPEDDGYIDIGVSMEFGATRLVPGGSTRFRLVQDTDGWWVVDRRCFGGIFCDQFDWALVLEGIARDGDPSRGR